MSHHSSSFGLTIIMKAVIYYNYQQRPVIEQLPDPTPSPTGVVIKVGASGVCRSDWHGWMGHDSDICLPHVPGHELAGTVIEIGKEVKNWQLGDRVTVPFVGGCGHCGECISGNHQVCDNQFQPGFTHWGSFAEYVAIEYADVNLVKLPESMGFVTAASLGCRFATAFRGVTAQANIQAGQWLVVHGCGGVGLSSIMIAKALGAIVIAVDISEKQLALASEVGATHCINALKSGDVVDAIKQITRGGAHISIDALGSTQTCINSIRCLKSRGRHIQIGLMSGVDAKAVLPMGEVIRNELEIVGSHGMQAYAYDKMLSMIQNGLLEPEKLLGKTITLEQSIDELINMDKFKDSGITVIDKF
jgi:alcohol dehydrogenase